MLHTRRSCLIFCMVSLSSAHGSMVSMPGINEQLFDQRIVVLRWAQRLSARRWSASLVGTVVTMR